MPRIDTGIQDILSGPTGTPLFTPMTGALNSNELKDVHFRVYGAAPSPSALEVCPGVQLSDDGHDWTTYAPVAFSYTYAELPTGWTWTDFAALKNVFTTTGSARLFVRFGLFARAETASDPGSAQARLQIECTDVPGWTVTGGPKLVGAPEKTVPAVFWPLTEWRPSTDAVKARATLEIVTRSNDGFELEASPAYQVANDLTDPTTWVSASSMGNYAKYGLISYPSQYYDIGDTSTNPPLERYVRFGVLVQHQGSGDDGKASAVVNLRVDVRAA